MQAFFIKKYVKSIDILLVVCYNIYVIRKEVKTMDEVSSIVNLVSSIIALLASIIAYRSTK